MKTNENKNEVKNEGLNEVGDEAAVMAAETIEPTAVPEPIEVVKAEKGRAEPNEAFFGSLLLICLIISCIAATGYFGWAGYRYFKARQAEQAIPSIESLPMTDTKTVADEAAAKPADNAQPDSSTAESAAALQVDKKTLDIKVLNGGSVKGAAGTFVEKLKQAGYVKAVAGNTLGDYTGQTLYYAKGQDAISKVIQSDIAKTYPGVVIKEAPSGDKDATAANFVIILGK